MQLMFTLGLPLVYFGAFTLLHAEFFLKECDRLGDYPLLTLEIQRAADFKALLGPYSRHGFNHPGPFSLYVFALGERLLFFIKSFYGRYALTQLLMSLVFISGSLRLIYRHFGAAQSAFAFTTILLYFAAERRTSFFCDIWGPALLPSAMLAFLCTSAALATGNLKPFLLWSIAFSVLASNHLGTWPVVGPISVFALGKGVPNINKHATKIDRPTKLSIAAGLLVILAAALPPLIELIIKPGLGNLGKILHFSLYRTENKPFPQSLAFLVSFYDLNLGLFALPGFILFPMLTLICFLVKLPRWQFAWNLRAAILACPFLVLPGILKIRGELHAFILWHQYAVAALLLTCSAHGLMLVFPQLRVGFSKYATTAFLSAALVISAMDGALRPPEIMSHCRNIRRGRDSLKPGKRSTLYSRKHQGGCGRGALRPFRPGP